MSVTLGFDAPDPVIPMLTEGGRGGGIQNIKWRDSAAKQRDRKEDEINKRRGDELLLLQKSAEGGRDGE